MYFIKGRSIGLKPFDMAEPSSMYLEWLNDPEVNQYSSRRFAPTGLRQARTYLDNLPIGAYVLAVCLLKDGRHVGNLKYGPIDWPNRCAEIEIMLGDKRQWGKGLATEAIYLVTKHLFFSLGLHRVEAKSCNPAFIKVVREHLGWKEEGRLRQRFRLGGDYVDYIWLGLLDSEFVLHPELEAS